MNKKIVFLTCILQSGMHRETKSAELAKSFTVAVIDVMADPLTLAIGASNYGMHRYMQYLMRSEDMQLRYPIWPEEKEIEIVYDFEEVQANRTLSIAQKDEIKRILHSSGLRGKVTVSEGGRTTLSRENTGEYNLILDRVSLECLHDEANFSDKIMQVLLLNQLYPLAVMARCQVPQKLTVLEQKKKTAQVLVYGVIVGGFIGSIYKHLGSSSLLRGIASSAGMVAGFNLADSLGESVVKKIRLRMSQEADATVLELIKNNDEIIPLQKKDTLISLKAYWHHTEEDTNRFGKLQRGIGYQEAIEELQSAGAATA